MGWIDPLNFCLSLALNWFRYNVDILAIIIHGIEYNPISYPADLFIIFFCSQNSLKCVIMEQWPALQNKLKIYVEQDIFMHVLAGALQMKRIGNRLEI